MTYAEELNYWKSGKSSAEKWLDRSEKVITGYGGEVIRRAVAREHNREALLLEFILDGEQFRVVWPVLESRGGDKVAARRQAATMMFHDIKGRGVRLGVFGARHAFFDGLVLPGGTVAGELADPSFRDQLPEMLQAAIALLPESTR